MSVSGDSSTTFRTHFLLLFAVPETSLSGVSLTLFTRECLKKLSDAMELNIVDLREDRRRFPDGAVTASGVSGTTADIAEVLGGAMTAESILKQVGCLLVDDDEFRTSLWRFVLMFLEMVCCLVFFLSLAFPPIPIPLFLLILGTGPSRKAEAERSGGPARVLFEDKTTKIQK